MDHPVVAEIERTGYPIGYQNNVVGTDALGNELYKGDSILQIDNEKFLVDELTPQSIEILETLGAYRKNA